MEFRGEEHAHISAVVQGKDICGSALFLYTCTNIIPLHQLFSSEVYIILPSKPRYSPSVYNRAARRIASAWHKIAAGKCYIVQDDFLSNGGIVKNILVSLGTPGENRIVDIIMKNKKKDTGIYLLGE